ncbi:hypothetical protein NDN08_002231 [Rhodosorus marinus]|uniref:3-deoxy-manno-octulosonate cytidylyltransferase n=1 Tax=Rhodosorus marinus TaxID=101924 RepID=A0AAV8UYX8_9RHOD|nr:hypothetical protein NDN08_002231 [Rhodosorus marinus]
MTGALVVIPARYGSTRFPGKPLKLLAGVPIVLRTLRNAQRARITAKAIVATDDERIVDVVRAAGGSAVMTSPDCSNGTKRVIEAVKKLSCDPYDVIVNVQGDEPLINPDHIDRAMSVLTEMNHDDTTTADVGTIAVRIEAEEDVTNPDTVKCVVNARNEVMYFSRAPIPFQRSGNQDLKTGRAKYLRHLGIYAFSREFLTEKIPQMAPSGLEMTEMLEQLTWLYCGAKIKVGLVNQAAHGVDTQEDLDKLEEHLSSRKT